MTIAKTSIEGKIRDMILATASLNGLNKVITGVLFEIPVMFYPCVEIILATQQLVTEETGGFKVFEYAGDLVVNVFKQDLITTTDRSFTVASTTEVTTYVDELVKLFSDNANHALQFLTFTNGRVDAMFIGDSTITYGVARRNERSDNLTNFAFIPFRVRTTEQDV